MVSPVAKDFAFGGEIPVGVEVSVTANDIISEFGTDADSDLNAASLTFNTASIDGGPTVPLGDIGFSYTPGAGDAGGFTINNKNASAFAGLGNGETAQVVITFTVSDGSDSVQGSLSYTVTGTPGTYDVELNYLGENVVGQDVQADSQIGETAAEFEFSGDSTLNDIADDLDISQIDSFDFVDDLDGNSLTGAFAVSDSNSSAVSATETTATSFVGETGAEASAMGDSTASAASSDASLASAMATGNSAASASAETSSNATATATDGSASQATGTGNSTATATASGGSTATASAIASSTSTVTAEDASSATAYSNDTSSATANATQISTSDAVAMAGSNANASATNGSDALAVADDDSDATAQSQDQSSSTAAAEQGSTAGAAATNGSTDTAVAADQSEATTSAGGSSVSQALALAGANANATANDSSGSRAEAQAANAEATANTNASGANAFAFRSGTATADATDDALSSAIAADGSSADADAQKTSASRAFASSGNDNALAPLPNTIGPGVAGQSIAETTGAVTIVKALAADYAQNLIGGGDPSLSTIVDGRLSDAPIADPTAANVSNATANATENSSSEARASDGSTATSTADVTGEAIAAADDASTASATANNESSATAAAAGASNATAFAAAISDSTALALQGSTANAVTDNVSSAAATGTDNSDALAHADQESTSVANADRSSSSSASATDSSVASSEATDNSTSTSSADTSSASSATSVNSSVASVETAAASAATGDTTSFSGQANTAIPMPLDADAVTGSDVQSTTIATLPAGSVLSAGTPNGDGSSWTFAGPLPPDLTITPPPGFSGDIEFTIQADTSEASVTTTQTLSVENTILGTPGPDDMEGTEFADDIRALASNDIIEASPGNDDIDGGPGTDTVEYAGNSADYTVTRNSDGTLTVTDNNTGDGLDEGTDTLMSVERIRFLGDGVTQWYPAVRFGDEIRVNEHTEGVQDAPRTIQLADGRLLYVFTTWNSTDGDFSGNGIATRIATVNTDGSVTFTDEHRVNEHTFNDQFMPKVMQLVDGRVLFLFRTDDATDGDASLSGISARVGTANADGTFTFSDEVRVNETTLFTQTDPEMIPLADGRVLFVYQSWAGSPGFWDINARVGTVNGDGTITFTDEFLVSEDFIDNTLHAGAIQLEDGRVVFVYGTNDTDNGDDGLSVVARVGTINPDGSATLGGEIRINQHTENSQHDVKVTQLADGRVLFTFVTNSGTEGDADGDSIAARVGAVQGDGSIVFGDEFRVNEHVADDQDTVEVIQLSDGRVLFVYRTEDITDGDASRFSLAARVGTVEADGSMAFSEEFRINEHVQGEQHRPAVTELADGRVVFTFTTDDPTDGDFDSDGIATRIIDFGGGGSDEGETLVGLEPGVALMGYGGADTLIGSNGNDLLDGGLGPDLLFGGPGADRFILGDTTDLDTIADFNASDDLIDVSSLFAGMTLTQANVSNYLRLDMVDGLCVLQFDPDGPIGNGAGAPFQHAALVEGLQLGDTVQIIDDAETAPVIVNITYDGPLSPWARDDEIIVVDNAPTAIDLFANDDFGADGVNLQSGVTFSNPGEGSIGFDPDTGLFTYTPSGGFTGPDTFTYTLEDNTGDQSTATVHLDVRDPADIPSPVVRLDDEGRVNEHIAQRQWYSNVAKLPDGRLVFAFETYAGADGDADENSIGGRVGTVSDDGTIAFGDEFRVNEHIKDWQFDPNVSVLADGRLLFTFQTRDPTDGDNSGAFGLPDSVAGRIGTVNGDGSVTFGDEFRINEHTARAQIDVQVVQLADGRVLFTFSTEDATDSAPANANWIVPFQHVAARVGTVNPDGSVTFTDEHRVNEHTAGWQSAPQVTELADGRLLFTFTTYDSTNGDGDGNSVAGRVATVNPNGTFSFGEEFRVNEHISWFQSNPQVIQLADGRVLFLFRTDDTTDGDESDYGLAARIGMVQADGSVEFGDEFRVNEHTVEEQENGQVLQLADGRVLFVFSTEDPTDGDESNDGIAARIGTVRKDGTVYFGDEFRINLGTENWQSVPRVAQLDDGRLVFTFSTEASLGGDDVAVAYRIVDLDGQGTERSETLVATHGGGKLAGLGGDDTLIGSSGDDCFLWNVGDGRDTVDGGAETHADIMEIHGDGTAETFDIYSNAEAVAQIGYAGDAEIVVARNGTIIAELTEIEDIVIDGQGGGDTFNTHGSFDGTNLATSTITHFGSAADDTVDLSGLSSEHRVVFHAGGGDDAITGDRDQDLIDITGLTIVSVEPIAGDRFRVTFDNGSTLTYDGNAGFAENTGTDDETLVTIAPTAQDDTAATDEDTAIQVTAGLGLLANDSDFDGGTLSIVAVNGNAFVFGTPITLASGARVTVNADGSYAYDPNSAFEALNEGQADTDSFTYTIDDGQGGQASATVTIDIDGRDDGPILGTPDEDTLDGTGGSDDIRALASDDTINGSGGSDLIDGGPGHDDVVYDGERADYTQTLNGNGTITVEKPGGVTDTLTNMERIDFTDGDYVYDLTSPNTGFGYRIYQASFGRTPDEGGVRFWIGNLDNFDQQGWSDYEKEQFLASQFIQSDEFRDLYGANPSNFEYIDAMYQNVLFRLPDQAGYDFWVGGMENDGLTREDILIAFTKSDENVNNNSQNLDDGVWVV